MSPPDPEIAEIVVRADEPAPPRRPRRYGVVQPFVVLWLTVVWCALWGSVAPMMVVSGVLIAIGTCVVFPLPPLRFHARIHPWALLRLAVRFVVDLVVASVQVSAVVLFRRPGRLRNAVIEVNLTSPSDFVLTGVAILLSLVPGSVVVEARRSTHTLYLHVIDVDTEEQAERFRRTVLALEQRVLKAFEPTEEPA